MRKRAAPGGPTDALVVGAGFLGRHLVAALRAEGVAVKVLTRRAPAGSDQLSLAGVPTIVADAADAEAVASALDGVQEVLWCTGGLLPADSNVDPVGDVTASLPPLLTMLEALREHPGARMTLFSSGGTIYGNPTVLPVPESYPPQPLSSHGVMKLAAEQYVRLYGELHDVRGLILRCSNVYGSGQRGDRSQGLIAAALSNARTGSVLPVYGDGTAVRDYLHVDDLVAVALALLKLEAVPPVVNVGSGRGVSVRDVLVEVESVTGRQLELDWRPTRPGDVSSVVLDVTRLHSLLDFRPTPLHDGIASTWASLVEGEYVSR